MPISTEHGAGTGTSAGTSAGSAAAAGGFGGRAAGGFGGAGGLGSGGGRYRRRRYDATWRRDRRMTTEGAVTHPVLDVRDVVKTYGAGETAVHALRGCR